MMLRKPTFLLLLAMIMVLGTMTAFAQSNDDMEEVQWIEGPSLGQVKNNKVEVSGRLDIPDSYWGPKKIMLLVGGFNVVPDHEGYFEVGVFKGAETQIEVKVFAGKDEIEELEMSIYYLEDFSNVNEVVAMIDALPDLHALRLTDKEAVEEARAAYENLSEIEKTFVNNLDRLMELEEKIAYLENEVASDIRFTQVSPQPYDLYSDSTVRFEGYFYNARYMESVLIEDIDGNVDRVEADIEFIEEFEIGGRVYPAYKYVADIELDDGYYVMRVIGLSQSGQRNNTAARFSVDTTAPELDLEVLGLDENNVTRDERVQVNVTMRDNFANMTLYAWDSYEFGQNYDTSDRRFREPAEYSTSVFLNLQMGENQIPFRLVDGAGNERVETLTIIREPLATGQAQIQIWKDSNDRVDFDLINDSFYLKNKETGEEFRDGTSPWNIVNGYRMSDIPEGEYTIHFDLPEGLYINEIQLGGAYGYSIYDPEDNPFVVEDLGSNYNNARIYIRATTLLKEIRELNISLPNDMTYEEYLEMRPDTVIVVDENDVEYEVDARFSPNRVQYENGRERGNLRVQSQSTITLPLYVSNTVPAMRTYAYLNITFVDPASSDTSIDNLIVEGREARLNPEDNTIYNVTVPYGSELTLDSLNLDLADGASMEVDLVDNVYTIVVTAEDGLTSETYTVNVTIAGVDLENSSARVTRGNRLIVEVILVDELGIGIEGLEVDDFKIIPSNPIHQDAEVESFIANGNVYTIGLRAVVFDTETGISIDDNGLIVVRLSR